MLREVVARWRHVFKLDPNRVLSEKALEVICQSGTDAIIVGGTDGITFENTFDLLRRLRRYPITCVQEISVRGAVMPGFDGYLIPTVLNSKGNKWILGAHHEAIKVFGAWIPWDKVVSEGYIVLNPKSKVAQLTGSQTKLETSDLTAYARLAEHLFHLPIVYVEYSGTFGDPAMVEAARNGLRQTRLFYGGGIETEAQARQMGKLADTIVVGNLIYRNVEAAVNTVKWVKKSKTQESTTQESSRK